MSVGQTIGRLCQPARDILGGLGGTLGQHLNFPSDLYRSSQSLLYIIRSFPQESPWAARFLGGVYV